MQEEEVKEIPLVYPLVSIALKTTTIVDNRAVVNECEEILNFANIDTMPADIHKLVTEFNAYVGKVIEQASSPQGRGALQSILDNQPQAPSTPTEDPPSLTGSLEGLDQRKLP